MNELKMGDNSVRMQSATSKYITFVDIIMVQMIVVIGTINTPLCLNRLFSFVGYIAKIDSIIGAVDQKKQKAQAVQVLSLILLFTTFLLGLDLYVWHVAALTSTTGSEFILTNYLPYHISYFIVVLTSCQYAQMTYAVKKRITSINSSLKRISCNNKEDATPLHLDVTIDINNYLLLKNLKRYQENNLLQGFVKKCRTGNFVRASNNQTVSHRLAKTDHILQITEAYLTICDAVEAINGFFGHVIVVILVTSLLHHTVALYFFIGELTGRRDPVFLILQFLWLLAHLSQLMLIVEPCNMCLEEIGIMNSLVCRLLSTDVDGSHKKQLKLLLDHLSNRKIKFSAFGLGTVNRSLITSMAGAVAVYLVSIIQFVNEGNG